MRKMIKICTVLTFLLVLGAVVWSVRTWYRQQQENIRQVTALELAVASLDDCQRTHQRNLAVWYNYNLERKTPGLWSTYEEILDLGEGRMAVLAVPELGLKLPVSHGTDGIVGHDVNTAFPIGGRERHTVLFLSRRYAWTEGMLVSIECLGRQLIYRVESLQVMPLPWSAERPAEAGQDLLTLVYDGKNTRTIIRCVRCHGLTVREKETLSDSAWLSVVLLLMLIVSAGLRHWSLRCKHMPENCRFSGEKPGKTKLF